MLSNLHAVHNSNTNKVAMQFLAKATTAKSKPDAAEKFLQQALHLAPYNLSVRLGAYRFYFYNHRYADALPHAEFIIVHYARQLNIPINWRTVRLEDSDFTLIGNTPGTYLQALLAWGYCNIRLGNTFLGRQAIAKVVEIDPSDRFNAKAILDILEHNSTDLP
ncbi:MAG: hypothetical protein TECD_00799 [Hyphomicrobiaceae bacterium hypho_1]